MNTSYTTKLALSTFMLLLASGVAYVVFADDMLHDSQVAGVTTKPIEYHLWWDCDYAGTDVTEAEKQCGDLDIQAPEVPETPETPTGSGDTYYVATSGSDGNSCTQAQNINTPKKTIWGGVQCLSGGDILLIRGGTYREGGISTSIKSIPSGTSWDNATIISGYQSERPLFQPVYDGAYGCCGGAFNFDKGQDQYIVVKNMRLDASHRSPSERPTGIRFAEAAHHIRVENVEISYFVGQGIFSRHDTHHLQILNSYLHHNGHTQLGHNIYWGSDDSLLDGLIISDSVALGIQLFSSSSNTSSADRNILRNSKIYNNTKSGIAIDGDDNLIYNNLIYGNTQTGINIGYTPGSDGNKIYNNTIVQTQGYGISLGSFGSANGTQVVNNILAYNSNAGIDVGTTSGGGFARDTRIQFNLFYQNGGGSVIIRPNSSNTTQSDNIQNRDPLFVGRTSNNYHVQSTSPVIDAAITRSEVANDLDGTPRPQGGAYDIGAYER